MPGTFHFLTTREPHSDAPTAAVDGASRERFGAW
jgi:hypothetical protein